MEKFKKYNSMKKFPPYALGFYAILQVTGIYIFCFLCFVSLWDGGILDTKANAMQTPYTHLQTRQVLFLKKCSFISKEVQLHFKRQKCCSSIVTHLIRQTGDKELAFDAVWCQTVTCLYSNFVTHSLRNNT